MENARKQRAVRASVHGSEGLGRGRTIRVLMEILGATWSDCGISEGFSGHFAGLTSCGRHNCARQS